MLLYKNRCVRLSLLTRQPQGPSAKQLTCFMIDVNNATAKQLFYGQHDLSRVLLTQLSTFSLILHIVGLLLLSIDAQIPQPNNFRDSVQCTSLAMHYGLAPFAAQSRFPSLCSSRPSSKSQSSHIKSKHHCSLPV